MGLVEHEQISPRGVRREDRAHRVGGGKLMSLVFEEPMCSAPGCDWASLGS